MVMLPLLLSSLARADSDVLMLGGRLTCEDTDPSAFRLRRDGTLVFEFAGRLDEVADGTEMAGAVWAWVAPRLVGGSATLHGAARFAGGGQQANQVVAELPKSWRGVQADPTCVERIHRLFVAHTWALALDINGLLPRGVAAMGRAEAKFDCTRLDTFARAMGRLGPERIQGWHDYDTLWGAKSPQPGLAVAADLSGWSVTVPLGSAQREVAVACRTDR